MIKIAIVEDDEAQIELLRSYIDKYSADSAVGFAISCFSDGMQFISEYNASFDIVFMDIDLPLLDGISTARKLRELDEDVCLIFCTNLAKYALIGYEVNAMDYMLKPIKYFNFVVKLERAIRLCERKDSGYLMIKSDDGVKKINFDDILYIEVFGHMASIQTGNEKHTTRVTLGQLKDKLPDRNFFQCSRSIIINLKYLIEIKELVYCQMIGLFYVESVSVLANNYAAA